jgi:hypothetical protein
MIFRLHTLQGQDGKGSRLAGGNAEQGGLNTQVVACDGAVQFSARMTMMQAWDRGGPSACFPPAGLQQAHAVVLRHLHYVLNLRVKHRQLRLLTTCCSQHGWPLHAHHACTWLQQLLGCTAYSSSCIGAYIRQQLL